MVMRVVATSFSSWSCLTQTGSSSWTAPSPRRPPEGRYPTGCPVGCGEWCAYRRTQIRNGSNRIFVARTIGPWYTTPPSCGVGKKDIVTYLLCHGANCLKEDSRGKTPRFWAEKEGHTDVALILKEAEDRSSALNTGVFAGKSRSLI
ncbi:hypothetical protein M011DRAFT_318732 [Sporormia fimetaria CBS 119925]|uniref:Uncharacterized protein n=1 Tax=Sporormia fimetaria CBS 119925 TaxID=1340428 RepID=A0A6A6UV48_9PLEO|nr:hypothetical protein M011DRAFT_318732 [Sporormia fimetaria CBS 119925]